MWPSYYTTFSILFEALLNDLIKCGVPEVIHSLLFDLPGFPLDHSFMLYI